VKGGPPARGLVDGPTFGWCSLLAVSLFVALWLLTMARYLPIAHYHPGTDLIETGRRLVRVFQGVAATCLLASAWAVWAMWRRMSRRAAAAGAPGRVPPGLRVVPAVVVATLLSLVAAYALYVVLPPLLHRMVV